MAQIIKRFIYESGVSWCCFASLFLPQNKLRILMNNTARHVTYHIKTNGFEARRSHSVNLGGRVRLRNILCK